jgi:hypothetical protein
MGTSLCRDFTIAAPDFTQEIGHCTCHSFCELLLKV